MGAEKQLIERGRGLSFLFWLPAAQSTSELTTELTTRIPHPKRLETIVAQLEHASPILFCAFLSDILMTLLLNFPSQRTTIDLMLEVTERVDLPSLTHTTEFFRLTLDQMFDGGDCFEEGLGP